VVIGLTAVPPAPGANTPSGLLLSAPTGGHTGPADTLFALPAPPSEASGLLGDWLSAPGDGGADPYGVNAFFPDPFLPAGGLTPPV
jgi:hypothetical protein